MGDEEHLYKSAKIKFKGNIDIRRMYNKILEWLEEEDFKVKEDMYIERIKPEGKAIEIVWTAEQSKHPYINWKSQISIYITGIKETEIETEGRKLKLSNCTTEVKFDAWHIINPKNEYRGFIKSFYEKFIIGKKIEEERELLFKSMQELVSEFKSFLTLYQS